jgi:DNA-binding NtrC family response regulator
VAKVAQTDATVLILGETGTGKELLARAIHKRSRRACGAFIRVNFAAIPPSLIASELFGHEKGAFTGALQRRLGRFEAADGGTIFLDELGNLSAQGQAKLLRVLQTGEYERLGSNTTRRTRARVIAATNASLPQLIKEGKFREDLFYRLNVIELEVPPLAARPEDIVPLAQHFLEPGFSLSPDALRALARYHWPGNVRELRNAIHRACLLSVEPVVTAKALNLPVAAEPSDGAHIDRQAIEQALLVADGVVAQAARDLGLSRQALYRRMEKLGLKAPVDPGRTSANG